jgi:hypothetical protein
MSLVQQFRSHQDPISARMEQPSASLTIYRSPYFDYRWVIAVVLSTTLGLFSIAMADTASRHGNGYTSASVFFWVGLLLIFVPIAFRVLMPGTDRNEQLTLVILLGVALYLVKVFYSPDMFAFGDEFIHWRTTQDILRTHHLFSYNPLLPTAAYYPGLAGMTAGLVDLTGLSPFASGVLLIGLARVVFSACLFLVATKVTGSGRAAAGASLVYAANPQFLFWSSGFSYENLALPLAAFVVWWFGRTRQESGRLAQTVTVIAIVAVTVTHHVVGFALTGLLGAWWLAARVTRRPIEERRRIGFMTLVAGTTTMVWLFFIARPAASYLFTDNVFPALRQTVSVLFGHTARRHLYSSGGYVSPTWQTYAGLAAVAILIVALPLALLRAWQRRDHASMAVAIGVAVAYPLSLVPRLAPEGVAISGRSSEFVFMGLGCVLGLLATESAWTRLGPHLYRAKRFALVALRRTAVATGLVTLVFVGDVTIGTAFYQLLPESAHPQGYPWAVQPDAIRASKWAREHLGSNQPFGADAIDALALATYGEQDPVNENKVWPIFFAPVMSEAVVHSIRASGVRYLMVDWRMTKGVPATPGYYFSPLETGAGDYVHPFPAGPLKKFTSDACMGMDYDSGYVQIFDVSRIANGSCIPALTHTAGNSGRRP